MSEFVVHTREGYKKTTFPTEREAKRYAFWHERRTGEHLYVLERSKYFRKFRTANGLDEKCLDRMLMFMSRQSLQRHE